MRKKGSLTLLSGQKLLPYMAKDIRRGRSVKSAVLAAKQRRQQSKILNQMTVLLTEKIWTPQQN